LSKPTYVDGEPNSRRQDQVNLCIEYQRKTKGKKQRCLTERIFSQGFELCRQSWAATLIVLGKHLKQIGLSFVKPRHPELRDVTRHTARRSLPLLVRRSPLLDDVVSATEISLFATSFEITAVV